MNCQRKGTNLKIEVRLALYDLGRNPYEMDKKLRQRNEKS